ncbi:hypothetical protein MMC13_004188 [Lambiella insularis]|nr:hypothetical protein [Lambiella insularis]
MDPDWLSSMELDDYNILPPLPELMDFADPFLGHHSNSPLEDGWIETPNGFSEPAGPNLLSNQDGTPAFPDFDISLEGHLAQPSAFGNAGDFNSPSWLDSFLADIDEVMHWQPSCSEHALDGLFSHCSRRRTGSPNSGTNLLSDDETSENSQKRLDHYIACALTNFLGFDKQFASSRDLYLDARDPSANSLWEELDLPWEPYSPPSKVLKTFMLPARCFRSDTIATPNPSPSMMLEHEPSLQAESACFSSEHNVERLNDWLDNIPIPLIFRNIPPPMSGDSSFFSAEAAHDQPDIPPTQLPSPKSSLDITVLPSRPQTPVRSELPIYRLNQFGHSKRISSTHGSDCSSMSPGSIESAGSNGSYASNPSHASWNDRKGKRRKTNKVPFPLPDETDLPTKETKWRRLTYTMRKDYFGVHGAGRHLLERAIGKHLLDHAIGSVTKSPCMRRNLSGFVLQKGLKLLLMDIWSAYCVALLIQIILIYTRTTGSACA